MASRIYVLEIKLILKTNRELIQRCVKLADTDYFDNIVLLGDLFFPCIKLTDIYGVFDNKKLISFFTIFKGFGFPSVVLWTELEVLLLVPSEAELLRGDGGLLAYSPGEGLRIGLNGVLLPFGQSLRPGALVQGHRAHLLIGGYPLRGGE